MVEILSHPLVVDPPGGLCWKRSERGSKAYFPQAHAELVVLICISGQADYYLDGEVVPLTAGTTVWAQAGQSHFLLDERPGFDMWVILVARRLFPHKWHENPSSPTFGVDEVGETWHVRQLDIEARRELEQIANSIVTQADPDDRKTGLRWLLLRTWQLGLQATANQRKRLHPAVADTVQILEDDPSVSLEQAAQSVGLSPGRLSKVFAQQLGEGFASFRNKRRLARVDMIMRANRATSLLDAALEAGFGSYAQFYRSFRSMKGENPRTHYGRK